MKCNPFVIRVLVNHTRIPILITHVYNGSTLDRYEAKGIEHPHIQFIVQTDGQYLKSINSRKQIKWQLYKGDTGYMDIFNAVCRGIKNKWAKVQMETEGAYPHPKNTDLPKFDSNNAV